MTLEKQIKEHIFADGPMNIAEYMVLALTHPDYGYYMRKDPFGVQGDFTTAPEISQIFGELIGAWLVTQWVMMGKPQAALAEIGPGRGTLMADILRATARVRGFHEAVTVHLQELSPVLRQKQWSMLAGKHPEITWHTGFAEIPQKPLLLVANEFFDALPIRQYLHAQDGWKERKIGLDRSGRLEFVLDPATPPEPLERQPVSEHLYEYCDAARQMGFVIANRIAGFGGSALIIDYGYADGSHGDSLQAVRNHRHHEVLEDPGTADITAHVDFETITHAAAIGGCTVYGPVGQGFFLNRLGALERTAALCEKATEKQKEALTSGILRLTASDQMGSLFKVLSLVPPELPKPEGF